MLVFIFKLLFQSDKCTYTLW